jgi:UDP:flavonoid glycosyltransferase YjiC (YdhE family)
VNVLFTSLRNTSHFLPLVPFIEACRRAGHDVAVAAPPELGERVAKTGASFFPFAHPGDAALRPIWERLRGLPADEANRVVLSEIFAGVDAAVALPELCRTVERFRPGLVIRESQEYAAIVAAERFGVPHARVAISVGMLETKGFEYTAPVLDTHRARLDLPLDPSGSSLRAEPSLTQIPASFEFPEGSPPAELVSRFRVPRQKPNALSDWWSGSQAPLVYLTLGTVAGSMDHLRSAYRAALDAVAALPVRVLLTIGNDLPLDALGAVPANVHVERFVPQGDVLPNAAAVICHGGTGSVLGALAHGVPLVVTSMFADQPLNAERVGAVGAGIGFQPAAATPDALRAALTRVLQEPSFRVGARRLAAEIDALPAIERAVDRIVELALPA